MMTVHVLYREHIINQSHDLSQNDAIGTVKTASVGGAGHETIKADDVSRPGDAEREGTPGDVASSLGDIEEVLPVPILTQQHCIEIF